MDFAELEKIDKAVAPRKGLLIIGFGDGAKEDALAVCKKGVGAVDGIAHRAVAHGSQPARIVAQHPADCGLSGGRDLDRKEKIVRVERRLQRRRRASRLHRASAVLRVDLGDPREIFGEIDDDAFAKGLSGGRGAAAARDNGQAFFAGHLDDDGYVVCAFGANDASGETLIDGRIGGVAPPREEVACGVAFDLMRKPVPERRSGPSNRHFPSMRQSSSARLTQTVPPRRADHGAECAVAQRLHQASARISSALPALRC